MVERERFVPQRLGPLVAGLSGEPWPDPGDADRFRAASRLISALYHHEFHEREQTLLDAWEHLDDTPEAAPQVTADLSGLLDGANYTPVTMAELDDALNRESLIPLRFEVDLDDYEELLIYRRGSHHETVEVPRWRGLRSQERTITVDERVVVHTRIKGADWFEGNDIDPAKRNLVPGHVSLKQFQNVPRADIEMLLPSTQVRFRPIDTLLVGLPAVASGIAVLATKLLPTLGLLFLVISAWIGLRDEQPTLDQTSLVILFGGAVTLGGYLFRQWSKFKNRRMRYLKTLSENLYFRTLADGPGVFHTLLASAEEQNVVEALLAYRFLLTEPDGLTEGELDAVVEAWLRGSCHVDVDFEVDDAVAKLRQLDLVRDGAAVDGSPGLRAEPLGAALVRLDRRWDDLFDHPDPDRGSSASALDADGAAPAASAMRATRLVRLRGVVDRFRGRLGERRSRREGDDPSPAT